MTAFGRRIRAACAFAVLIVVALPASLGAALSPVLHQLVEEHRCACGMPAGQCGCRECARLRALARLEEDTSPLGRTAVGSPSPVIRSSCDDDSPAFGGGGSLIALLVPASVIQGAPRSGREPTQMKQDMASLPDDSPPTPPPRPVAV